MVLGVVKRERSVGEQMISEERIGINGPKVYTLIGEVRGCYLVITVSIVAAQIERAGSASQLESRADATLIDVGIGLGTDAERLATGLGVQNNRSLSEVAVFYRRNTTHDFNRLYVLGRYAAGVDTRIGRRSSGHGSRASVDRWVERAQVGVVRKGRAILYKRRAERVKLV